jgi:hypothetical protein
VSDVIKSESYVDFAKICPKDETVGGHMRLGDMKLIAVDAVERGALRGVDFVGRRCLERRGSFVGGWNCRNVWHSDGTSTMKLSEHLSTTHLARSRIDTHVLWLGVTTSTSSSARSFVLTSFLLATCVP